MGKGGKNPAALVDTRCSGHFKSFNKTKGWGFITCSSFPDDLFVSHNTAPALSDLPDQLQDNLAGQPVTFLLAESASTPGRYEAREIMLGEAQPSARARSIDGRPGCGKNNHGKGKRSAASLVGEVCSGHFKSFNLAKRWGFINCDNFPDDVFVSFNTSPELADVAEHLGDLAGTPVTFLLSGSASNPGQYEARNVKLNNLTYNQPRLPAATSHGKANTGQGGKGKGKRSPVSLVGRRCSGHFKSFHVANRWGFISCDAFPDDVFVSFKTAPELASVAEQLGDLAGQPVTFTLSNSASNPGQYEARDVVVTNISHASCSNNMVGKYHASVESGRGGKGTRASRPGALVGKRCSGQFKSFNMAKRWGFIRCNGLADDVFVSLNTAPELADVAEMLGDFAGLSVTFLLTSSASNPGQHEAREIMFDDVVYEESDGSEQQLYEGTFKSFNATNGWGFLSCPEIDGDVFVSYKTAPELRDIFGQVGQLQGQAASFCVQESKSTPGSYEATAVTLTGSSKGNNNGRFRSKPY
eukprot:TRINITY_DN74919_c0_g1_i1.p1 TRINITY_DN74919_c0_g1~~TRINITY_DN74919_c0_g1_i1.p1  ORF type:complete len:539 (-),score=102.19 TRINITY_DN74919_c0_g1_i1:216-1796(-)